MGQVKHKMWAETKEKNKSHLQEAGQQRLIFSGKQLLGVPMVQAVFCVG